MRNTHAFNTHAILRFKMTILRNQPTAVRYNTIFLRITRNNVQLWHIKSLTLYIFYFEVETVFHSILSCLKVKCVTSCSCFSLLWDVCIPGAVCHLNTDSLARLPSTLRARAVARSSRHWHEPTLPPSLWLQAFHPDQAPKWPSTVTFLTYTHTLPHTTEREHINSKLAQKQVNKIGMQINYYCR